jgi:excinuclease Cho
LKRRLSTNIPSTFAPGFEALPKQPGVYIFHGESDTLPLYIGKSVNIRSRVLSHLRTPDEAAMLRQSRRITWFQTAEKWARCCWKRG